MRLIFWLGVSLLVIALGLGISFYRYLVPQHWPNYDYGRPDRTRIEPLTLLNHTRVMGEILGEPKIDVKHIAILVYDGAETMEVIAPMVVFSELMSVKIDYVAPQPGIIATSQLDIVVTKTFEELEQTDLLVIPGGSAEAITTLQKDARALAWMKAMDQKSLITMAIGSGVPLFAQSARLNGRRVAVGSSNRQAALTNAAIETVERRYLQDGKYWSTQASTAAIDGALAVLRDIAGDAHLQAAMLDLEYAPETPTFALDSADTLLASERDARRDGNPQPASADPLRVGILVYDGFFALDAIGPLVMLSQLEDVDVRLIRRGDKQIVRSGRTQISVQDAMSTVRALDVLLIPGGAEGTWALGQDESARHWIRQIDRGSKITASVCTGSWVLGEAGLLQGRRATTNWYRAGEMMQRYGASYVPARYVQDGKLWTAAGVSAGLDLSVALAKELRGDFAARRLIARTAYWPEPPIRAGTPAHTDDQVLDMMHQMYDAMMMPLISAD